MATQTLKSLEKGVDLLFLFCEDRPELSLRDVALGLAVPESTAYRLLATLQKKGLIVHGGTRRYRLGTALLRLHATIRAHVDVSAVVLPHLEKLAAESGETSHLFLHQGNEVVCAEAVSSPRTIRFMPEKGKTLPLHASAAARVVLAFLPEGSLERYIREGRLCRLTRHTVIAPHAVRMLLAQIRRQRFAISFQQMYEGARGVAVPLFDHRGKVFGSLAVSGPDPRFGQRQARGLVPLLQEHASACSKSLSELLATDAGGPRRDPLARMGA